MIRSLYSGVSGLTNHQTKMDVIGNNIANVNTYGFKSSRTSFSDVYYQSLISPSGGTASYAGNNPSAVGYGMQVASIDKDMSQSSFQSTNRTLDLALSGDGFFSTAVFSYDGSGEYPPLETPPDELNYTRMGNFGIDSNGNLVSNNNRFIMGTRNTSNGLNAIGDISARELSSRELEDTNGDGFVTSADFTFENTININDLIREAYNVHSDENGVLYTTAYLSATDPALSATSTEAQDAIIAADKFQAAKDDLNDAKAKLNEAKADAATAAAEVTALKAGLDKIINVIKDAVAESNADAGDIGDVNDAIAEYIKDPTTIDDVAQAVEDFLADNPNQVVDDSNVTMKDLISDLADAEIKSAAAATEITSYQTAVTEAEGVVTTAEGEFATAVGAANMEEADVLTAAALAKNGVVPEGTEFDFVEPVYNEDGTLDTTAVTEIYFLCDIKGEPLMTEPTDSSINKKGSLIHFIPNSDISLPTDTFATSEDIIENGTYGNIPAINIGELSFADLAAFNIGKDGVITTTYNNQMKAIGRIEIAVCDNQEGLTENGETSYTESAASGPMKIKKPGESGAATVATNKLEMSNVNLAQEFSDMIVTQRGFQANARIITTSDSMLEELVNLKR